MKIVNAVLDVLAGIPAVNWIGPQEFGVMAAIGLAGLVQATPGVTGFDSALAEAQRLAKQHPGKKFFVLGAVAVAEAAISPVKTELVSGSVQTKVVPPDFNAKSLEAEIGRRLLGGVSV